MAKSKFVQANAKIADAVVGSYKKVENSVVGRVSENRGRLR